jgi:hypothetical protein
MANKQPAQLNTRGSNFISDSIIARCIFENKGISYFSQNVYINAELYAASLKCKNTLALPINNGSLDYSVPGTICYNEINQQLQISNGNSWNNILASPSNTTLTFRPGYTGDNTNGIYGNWVDLYNDLVKINGNKIILFDNLLIPNNVPIVIPPGNWDMTNTTWQTSMCGLIPPPELFIQLSISDGATVNGLCGIDGLLTVTYFGTTQPAITVNQQPNEKHALLYLNNGSSINIAGSQPFISVISGFYEILLSFGTHIQNGPNVVNCSTGAQTVIGLNTYSNLADNVLSGNGSFIILRFAPGSDISIPIAQPGITGTIALLTFYNTPDTYSRSAPPTPNDDSNLGYKIGDNWVDTSTNNIYFATNVTPTAVVWKGPY